MLIKLSPGKHGKLHIQPRWPSKEVQVDSSVLEKLQFVAASLPSDIELELSRAYEPSDSSVGKFRDILRFFGRNVFAIVYPSRRSELHEIFSRNGHDIDGRHVDIGIIKNGVKLPLLPRGVFTSLNTIDERVVSFSTSIEVVRNAVVSVGGTFHSNRLESLQMHVDFSR